MTVALSAAVSAPRQVRALLRLRWSMVRSGRVRVLIGASALLVVWVADNAARSAPYLEKAALASAIQLAPAAFLGFAFLALIAPLTGGGGTEVAPPDQLVAYPVRPATQFLGGLVLAPLNLVWVLQLVTLVAETSYVSRGGSGWRAALTAAAYVGCVTVFGQALAWWVAGLRQSAMGRRVVLSFGVSSVAGVGVGLRFGLGDWVLAHTPTRTVVHALAARPHELARWTATTLALLGLIAVGLAVGTRVCSWALRRPSDRTTKDTGPVRRRSPRPNALGELVAVNRASAWRAPALRRGAIVLAVLPGVAAAGTGVPWESLTILPGLVAAGAGLLFGINAFSLDGSGALWLASLPHPPRLLAQAKAVVLAETVAAAVGIAAVAGALRSPGSPTAADIAAIALSALSCTAVVVATGMSRSVRRPHHALLKGPRDSIAPPGAMVLASVQLSAPAAAVGLIFEATAHGDAWVSAAVAVPVLALAFWSLQRSLNRYDEAMPRARVVSVVSAG